MPLFGRKPRRKRAYRSGHDCSPWVLDGIWPADLNKITPETRTIAEYLRNDLLRIVESANDRLGKVARAGLDDQTRAAEEQRLLNVARAFAVLRVESTVRQLRRELGFRPELAALEAGVATDVPPPPRPHPTPQPPAAPAPEPEPEPEPKPEQVPPSEKTAKHRRPEDFGWSYPETAAGVDPPTAKTPPVVIDVDTDGAVVASVSTPARPDATEPPAPVEPEAEPAEQRLARLLRDAARQEPGLRWGVGERDDGTTLLVTDLAYGWIPPGINLPGGVELLPPHRRTGSVTALLADSATSCTYAPGQKLGAATTSEQDPDPSEAPRLLDMPDDLGAQLAAATQSRPGLPRLTHALAAAAANGGVVAEPEVDVLRVHMDTARYQLLANYPDVDNALLLNCMLLAATEAIATGDVVGANYHFAWFRALNAPAVTGLKPGTHAL